MDRPNNHQQSPTILSIKRSGLHVNCSVFNGAASEYFFENCSLQNLKPKS